MIEYKQAFKKAKKIIEKNCKYETITEVVEFEDFWIFLGGAKRKKELICGAQSLKIWKDSGNIENFPIPPIENLELLEKGKSIFKFERK